MATDEINFQDADGYLCATIDEQSLQFEVKEIEKTETVISLKHPIDTALNNSVVVNATIHAYNNDQLIPINKGSVIVSILNENMKYVYESQTINFTNGKILANMLNTLNIGTYYLYIEYAGNKFHLPSTFLTSFTISKRYVGYDFGDKKYSGYPTQEVDISLKLFDYETHKPINCQISYTINGNTFYNDVVNGSTKLHVIIPDVDPNKCIEYISSLQTIQQEIEDNAEYIVKEYYDDNNNLQTTYEYSILFDIGDINIDWKGYINENNIETLWFDQAYYYDIEDDYTPETEPNIEFINIAETDLGYQSYRYPIEINIISDSYYSDTIIQYIYAERMKTITGLSIVKNENNYITIEGDVVALMSDYDVNAQYGKVMLQVATINNTIYTTVDEYGHFTLNWKIDNELTEKTNQIEHYSDTNYALTNKQITVQITLDNNNTYKTGQELLCHAKVYISGNRQPVTDGMIYFSIYNKTNNKEIYRFPSELNEFGEAELNFDVSTEGNYYIKAHYCGIFEYPNKDSNVQYYNISRG